MKPLVPTILLGTTRFDQLGPDAELDPPDGELGEARDRGARKRIAVVGADPLRQAVLAEEVAETPDRGCEIEKQHAAAVEQEAGVAVLDRERIAEIAVAGPELALEVGRPGRVGLVRNRQRRP